MQQESKLCLLYLGKKGAAENFIILARQLNQRLKNLKIIVSAENNKLSEILKLDCEVLVLNLRSNPIRTFFNLQTPKNRMQIEKFIFNVSHVYHYIPHFTDHIIYRAHLKSKFSIRSIHDHRRHPGDLWPNRISILRLLKKSNYVLFHSNYVASKLSKRVTFTSTTALPLESRIKKQASKNQDILFIGRVRKYKGIRTLIQAWKIVAENNERARLIIAGKGKLPHFQENARIVVKNYWLSSEEFYNLIDECHCLVFPYTEASQSGPLSIAAAANKIAVISNKGALGEQIRGTQAVFFDGTASSLAHSILTSLQMEPFETMVVNENLELCNVLIHLITDGMRENSGVPN